MESIGTYLKRQREMRKVSLEEISQLTKISLKCLKAIEEDDWKSLPGDVFAKGFVRSYSKVIGLNADEAQLQFEEYLRTVADASPEKKDKIRWLKASGLQLKPWVFLVLLMVFVIVAAYISSR